MLMNFSALKKLVLFLLFLQTVSVYGGGEVKVKGRKFVLLPYVGGIWQHAPYGEFSIGHPFIHVINHSIGEKNWHSNGSHGGGYILTFIKLGTELTLISNMSY